MRWVLGATLLMVTLAGLPTAYWAGQQGWLTPASAPSSDPASSQPPPPEAVFAEGRLLPAGGLISIPLAPGDRVAEVLVDVGQQVAAGELLARTAQGELARLQVDLAEASRREAEQQRRQRLAAAEAERIQAQAELDRLETETARLFAQTDVPHVLEQQLQQARRKLERLESIAQQSQTGPLVSSFELADQRLQIEQLEQELDQQRAAARVALHAAAAAVEQAEQAVNLIEQASLASFDRQIELAEQRWRQLQVRAPAAGEVLKQFLEPGETAATEPLFMLADLKSMQCLAEVYQTSLRWVRSGQKVFIRSPALPRVLEGEVSRVDRLIGPSQLPNPNPLAPQDRRSGDVVIRLRGPDQQLAAEFVNLQVTVEIVRENSKSTAADSTDASE